MTFAQPFSGYEILSRIGAGAMGTVFRARQKHMNRIVALKVLKPSLARNEKYVERLRREARIVGQLNHPNIVTGFDLGEEGGYHYFVMEYVEGKSLRALLSEWGAFPEERVLDVGIQVASALDHAFQEGVIHRDVKPGNILIDESGAAKLTDMGLAKGPTDLTLTRDGATVGTPQFISPEQARDPKSVDVRSDLYSLGATLYQMATGIAPISADTIGELIHGVLHDYAPDARAINPRLSEGMSLVLRKLLMKDPALRYQTPAELLDDLRRIQRDESPDVDVRPIERAERSALRRAGGHAVRRYVAAGLGLVAIVLVTFFGWDLFARDGGDGVHASPVARPRFVAELRTALERTAAAPIGPRLSVCDEFRLRAENDAERGELARAEAPLVREARAMIRTVLADAEERIDAGEARLTDPQRWQDPERAVRSLASERFAIAFGVRPGELPAAARSAWEAGLRVLDGRALARASQRDEHYATAFREFLEQEVGRELETALAGDDFERARRMLQRGPSRFHGGDGRPTLAQVDEGLRARMRKAQDGFAARWTARIDARERGVVEQLRREIDAEVSTLRDALGRDDLPGPLARRLAAFRGRLAAAYPDSASFAAAADPWPEAEIELSRIEREIDGRLDVERLEAERSSLLFAYRVVADASVDDACRFLADLFARDESPAVRAHLVVLEAARDVRDRVLEKLIGGASSRDVRVRDGVVRVARVDGGGGFRLSDPDGGGTLPFAAVARGLLSHVPAALVVDDDSGEAGPRSRVGLAFWKLYAGDEGAGLLLLEDHPDRNFVTTRVASLIRESPSAFAGDRSPTQLVLRLQRARERGDFTTARSLLGELDRFAGTLQPENELLVARLEDWAEAAESRQARERELAAAATPGAVVRVAADGTEVVELDAPAILGLGLHDAWSLQGGGAAGGDAELTIEARSLGLVAAEARRLELPVVVDPRQGVECAFELRLPAQGSRPRVLLASVLGVHFAVVAMPNGSVLADRVEASSLRDADDLRRALSELLAAPSGDESAFLVDGAYARLRVRVLGRGRTRASVSIDDTPLCERRVHVSQQAPRRVRLRTFQSLGLRAVALRAPPR